MTRHVNIAKAREENVVCWTLMISSSTQIIHPDCAFFDELAVSEGTIGAFILAGYKSRFLHRDQNLEIFTSVDIKISLIIAISIALQIARNLAIIWELARLFASRRMCERSSKIILVFYTPSFQASVSKQGQGLYSGLISGMRSSVLKTELSRSAISEIFPPVLTSAKYLGISIAMEISIFLVCECA